MQFLYLRRRQTEAELMAMSEEKRDKAEKEGINLLDSPTFTELEDGRFRCVETGHEVLEKDRERYSQNKRCRLGLIDYAVSHRKPPLNMFKQDPNSRSKLICKLTGDTVNKSEEHIWKHINGKRFLNKLEKKELKKESNGSALEEGEEKLKEESKLSAKGLKEKKEKKKDKKKEKKEKRKGKTDDEVNPEVMDDDDYDDDDSEENKFWMPPVGDRWDFDDGGDRWGSGLESEEEGDEENETVEDGAEESEEKISKRAKRPSNDVGPSSFASKKKSRKNTKRSSDLDEREH